MKHSRVIHNRPLRIDSVALMRERLTLLITGKPKPTSRRAIFCVFSQRWWEKKMLFASWGLTYSGRKRKRHAVLSVPHLARSWLSFASLCVFFPFSFSSFGSIGKVVCTVVFNNTVIRCRFKKEKSVSEFTNNSKPLHRSRNQQTPFQIRFFITLLPHLKKFLLRIMSSFFWLLKLLCNLIQYRKSICHFIFAFVLESILRVKLHNAFVWLRATRVHRTTIIGVAIEFSSFSSKLIFTLMIGVWSFDLSADTEWEGFDSFPTNGNSKSSSTDECEYRSGHADRGVGVELDHWIWRFLRNSIITTHLQPQSTVIQGGMNRLIQQIIRKYSRRFEMIGEKDDCSRRHRSLIDIWLVNSFKVSPMISTYVSSLQWAKMKMLRWNTIKIITWLNDCVCWSSDRLFFSSTGKWRARSTRMRLIFRRVLVNVDCLFFWNCFIIIFD